MAVLWLFGSRGLADRASLLGGDDTPRSTGTAAALLHHAAPRCAGDGLSSRPLVVGGLTTLALWWSTTCRPEVGVFLVTDL